MSEQDKPKLSDKQRIFVEEYLQCWNATEAARRAGYKDPGQAGYENKKKQEIQDEISRRATESAMSADEVLVRIASFGRGSLAPFLSFGEEDVWPDLVSDEAQRSIHLLKKIKPRRRTYGPPENRITETEIELEIHDPVRALLQLGNAHGLFGDDSKILAALQAEREKVFAKLRKHLDAGDYEKAIAALSQPE